MGPTTVIVDGEDVINGTFEFSDPEGDADRLVFEVVLPDGNTRVIGPHSVQDLFRRTRGTVTFSLRFARDPAGRYEVTVWLMDRNGWESNRLAAVTVSRS